MINDEKQSREPLLEREESFAEKAPHGACSRLWQNLRSNLTKLPMTNEERLLLDPWQKWKLFNRVPLKGLLHLLLVILVTVQIILRAEQFAGNATTSSGVQTTSDILLFTRQDVFDLVENAVRVYYDFPKQTSDRFVYEFTGDGRIQEPFITIAVQDYDLYNASTNTWNFQYFRDNPVSETSYYIGNETGAVKEVLDFIEASYYRIPQIQVSFVWRSLDLSGVLGPVALSWVVDFYINLQAGSTPTDCYLDARSNVYAEEGTNALTIFLWLFIINILLSVCSLFLSIKALVAQARLFLQTRRNLKRLPPAEWHDISISSWDEVPFSTKLQFFDLWHQVTVIGNCSTIVGCVLGIIDLNGASFKSYEDLGMGLGAWFLCFNLLRYFEYNQRFFMLIGSVRLSFWRSMTFLLSVLPIFYGFALLGLVNFSQYTELFLNLDRASVTLYSMMNGDNIINAFNDVAAQYPYTWFTRLYLYTFTLFFITAVLNTFIFTLEEGFFLAKTYTKYGTFVSVDPKKEAQKKLEKEKKKGTVTVKTIDAETLLKAYDDLHAEVEHNDAAKEEEEEPDKSLPPDVERAFKQMEDAFSEEMEAEIARVQELEDKHRQRMLRFVAEYMARQGPNEDDAELL